ncbi:single-stranded-DNA-specific exonuclease [Liquorilactobacillus oeni DSM 19972]|uniref:Single-stranded-DNA-specific exonuclease RecJ n=1 Tax=Liquorilactobacillus oeni DSM 19972 TaxID=1423777 RepID=A0A0R1MFN5_9LACO|nr:single-stranded-DNA-specific exonuclease [Liquorilactobacillus oeni DSM 19972]
MFEPHYLWKKNHTEHSLEKIKQIEEEFGLSSFAAGLLLDRGLDSSDKVQQFLNPSFENLVDPFLMNDMKKAVERIQTAIVSGQKIIVYGDYDADGLTSTAVMYEGLLQLGADVAYYIPDRFKDGYGPNKEAYQKLIADKTELIVTVDNGISGNEAITYAKENNVDVIVTDHHELPERLPPAFAIVHPRYPGKIYPNPQLAGVGVAFKVVCALLEEVPQELLDLVAIGTVADLVPLIGENRTLVQLGLHELRQTQRIGLQALVQAAKINPEIIDEEKIGFGIAPRLNSLGRLENANLGIALLTTLDSSEAAEIAVHVEKLNQQRQKLVETITIKALAKLKSQSVPHLVNVVAASGWHEGVLGIVASRLVEKTGRPTLVLTINSESDVAKGSGRSVESFHLFKALDAHRKLYSSFGGHHMACGISLAANRLPLLQEILDKEAQKQKLDERQKPVLQIAAELPLDGINKKLITDLKKIAPYGPENPKPIFSFTDYKLTDVRFLGQKKNHVKLTLTGNKVQLDALAFSIEDHKNEIIVEAEDMKFCGKLGENTWKGRTKPQILICDMGNSRPDFKDLRTNRLSPELFKKSGTYFFFNQRIQQKLVPFLPQNAEMVIGLKKLPATPSFDELIIVDCPPSLKDLKKLLQVASYKKLVAIFYPYKPVYASGMPTRDELARVYRFAISHHNIDLKGQMQQVADYLQVKKELLIFMLQVFFEVGFVKIENGLMTGYPAHQTVNLKETPSYRSRQQLLKAEKTLLMSKTTDLKKWLFKLSAV